MKTDQESIRIAMKALKRLKCPELKRGEGNNKFIKFQSSTYFRTPDLVSGPNNGDKLDFYIDVHSPNGSMFDVNSAAYLSPIADNIENMVNVLKENPHGTIDRVFLSPYKQSYITEWENPLKKKSKRYGTDRNTHLFGLVGIVDGRKGGEDILKSATDFATLSDTVFEKLQRYYANDSVNLELLKEEKRILFSETGNLIRVQYETDEHFAFYLILGCGELKNLGLLLVNSKVFKLKEYKYHPTVIWLKKLYNRPYDIKLP